MKTLRESLPRLLKTTLILDAAILLIVVLVCLIAGWRTLHEYATALAWAGAVVLLIGFSSLLGGWDLTRSATYQYGQTVGQDSRAERLQRAMADENKGFDFLVLTALAAVGAFLISLVLESLAP